MLRFSAVAGTSTAGRSIRLALRNRVSISATGSVIIVACPHQLAFLTPGISPALARLRKQMRQMPNLRYTARARPHNLQRSEEHTSELQSRGHLVCRLLLEKKNCDGYL